MNQHVRPLSVVASLLLSACGAADLPPAAPDATAPPDLVMSSLLVTPASASVPVGVRVQFTAMDVVGGQPFGPGSDVTWVSSDPAVAIVDGSGSAKGLKPGMTLIRAGRGGLGASAMLTVTSASLTGVSILPGQTKAAVGVPQPFVALGSFTDGSSHDVSSSATWSTGDAKIATVDDKGVAVGKSAGMTTVTATAMGLASGDGGASTFTATAMFEVIPAALKSISVAPTMVTITAGATRQYTATGTYTDGSMVDITKTAGWSSSNGAVAQVNNGASKGLATGIGDGTAKITAASGLIAGSATITVTGATLAALAITPPGGTVAVNSGRQLVATGIYTDGTTDDISAQVTWTSSDDAIATVGGGEVLGVKAGTATITAQMGMVMASVPVVVTTATLATLAVTPSLPLTHVGNQVALRATGTFSDGTVQDLTGAASWSSSDDAVATVEDVDAKGLLSALKAGAVTVTATVDGTSATAAVTVSGAALTAVQLAPTLPTIAKGARLQLVAVGLYGDGTSEQLGRTVAWTTSNMNVIAIDDAGVALAGTNGVATVTATVGGVSGTTLVTVANAVLQSIQVTPVGTVLAKGTTAQLRATGLYSDGSSLDITTFVTFSASSGAVAAVSNVVGQRGVVTALAAGTSNIVAAYGPSTGSTAITVTAATLKSLSVSPASETLPAGAVSTRRAIGVYSDGTAEDVTALAAWTSSDEAVATVSSATASPGAVRAVAAGKATLTAAVGAIEATSAIAVTAATLKSLWLSPASPVLATNTSRQLRAIGVYSDGSTVDLTQAASWSSSNLTNLPVSNAVATRGLVRGAGLAGGTGTLTARVGGLTATANVTVTASALVSLLVTPQNVTISRGAQVRYAAYGTFADATTQDMTSLVTWTSSNVGVAFAANQPGVAGVVTTIAAGTVNIQARIGQITAVARLVVIAPTLQAITVTPFAPTLAKGTELALQAIGSYSDGSIADLSSVATFTSSDAAVAEVTGLAPRPVVYGVAKGSAVITATRGAVSGSTTVTVSAATLAMLAIKPAAATLARGTGTPLTLTGTFSDGSKQDLTAAAWWTSSAPAIATVGSTSEDRGFASAQDKGAATLLATVSGLSATMAVTVTPATVTGVTVSCARASLPASLPDACTAKAALSDSTTQDVTAMASWSVSDATVAVVGNGVGAGEVYALAAGTAAVTAVVLGQKGSTVLTVTPATLTSLAVQPGSTTIKAGMTASFTVKGTFSDSTSLDLTSLAWWTTAAPKVALVVAPGRVRAMTAGATTVKAVVGAVNATAMVTVQ